MYPRNLEYILYHGHMKKFSYEGNLDTEFAHTDSNVVNKPNLHNDLKPFLLGFPHDIKRGVDCTDA